MRYPMIGEELIQKGLQNIVISTDMSEIEEKKGVLGPQILGSPIMINSKRQSMSPSIFEKTHT